MNEREMNEDTHCVEWRYRLVLHFLGAQQTGMGRGHLSVLMGEGGGKRRGKIILFFLREKFKNLNSYKKIIFFPPVLGSFMLPNSGLGLGCILEY